MNWNNWIFKALCLITVLLPNSIEGIFEDQIGKFDWHQSFIGKVSSAHFPAFGNDLLLVTTEENALAALAAKSGALFWRQVLEKEPRGKLQFSTVFTDGSSQQHVFLTVSGSGNPHLVRGWDPLDGSLLWEWSIQVTDPERIEGEYWFYENLMLYHVLAYYGSHIEVTQYFASNGQQLRTGTSRITTPWIAKDACFITAPYFVCGVKNQILGVNLISDNGELYSKPLLDDIKAPFEPVAGLEATVFVNGQMLSLKGDTFASGITLKSQAKRYVDQNWLFQVWFTEQAIELLVTDIETNAEVTELRATIAQDDDNSNLFVGADVASIKAVKCKRKQDTVCRILLQMTDDSVVMLQQGKVKWSREESLANIATMDMVELPLSYLEGTIEDEFKSKDGNVWEGFVRRTSSQIHQIKSIVMAVMGVPINASGDRKGQSTGRNLLVRDAFGLHKMIVAVTRCGNVFGIDNMNGKVHWKRHLKELDQLVDAEPVKVVALRTARHFPHPIQYAIVGRNRYTGNGFIYQFNPITGSENSRLTLKYRIKQMAVLHESEESRFLRPLLMLDEQNEVHVLPEEFSSAGVGLYMYTVADSGILSGFHISAGGGTDKKSLKATPIWELNLSGPSNSQRVINVAAKSSIEHVHSQGRVLNDRSVLYKYINPNLVAVTTLGMHSVHKTVLNVYLVDMVSGAIIFSMSHKRAKEPFYMVHSENWIAYSYYNEKVRRTEITTMELYEGKTQANSTVWSSLDPPPLPLVERQSYIFPANIVALKETITEKGITNKDILIGLANGGIIEMPWALLDPRRPIQLPNQPREEGVIPYIPEIPIPTENIINYNRSVAKIRGIFTTPSGLESTCLVVAYGLDMFVTRVSPSKAFDLLKDDFDYFIITAVLIGLTTASYVVKQLASRKAQKQAWK